MFYWQCWRTIVKQFEHLQIAKIITARENQSMNIRIFEVPNLNLNASNYTEMLDWGNCDITEPPLIKNFSIAELKAMEELKFELPCHSQSVERCVQASFNYVFIIFYITLNILGCYECIM